jgi:AcrR family transcriptional regulator
VTAVPAAAANEQATRGAVIDAAVACILERGFYRASSNEIARRAGVTWGVIQYHFGTREALMLAVLEDGGRRFSELVAGGRIDGGSVYERISQLLDVLAEHYGSPKYLAYLQVALNLEHDPSTSAEVRATMDAVAQRSADGVRALVAAALGPATRVPDLAATLFLVLRGFAVSQQLLDIRSYDTVVPQADRIARQRRLLGAMLAPYIERAAAEVPGAGP